MIRIIRFRVEIFVMKIEVKDDYINYNVWLLL